MHNIKQRYRYSVILLRELVRTDFKIRYQNSLLGYVWSLLRPLLIFVILYLVFTKFLKIGTGTAHYPVYLLLGILYWNFFVEVTIGGVGAIVGKGDLIRKINFPKYVIILSVALSALINLALTSIVIAIFMIVGHVAVSWQALLLIPLILELIVISVSVAFFISAAFVKYRDVSYIWEVVIQGAFYATPILYPLSRIPHVAAKFLILNPLAQIIQDSRYVLITHETQTIATVYGGDKWIWGIPVGITVIVAFIAATYFRKRSRFFAEEV
ncbi:MAG TPA: ABC transporter permease [Candidatus Saccharimonadales bacterium]|nr:ABC transporter permease [Candidatus Saccharimonadales bacterium]